MSRKDKLIEFLRNENEELRNGLGVLVGLGMPVDLLLELSKKEIDIAKLKAEMKAEREGFRQSLELANKEIVNLRRELITDYWVIGMNPRATGNYYCALESGEDKWEDERRYVSPYGWQVVGEKVKAWRKLPKFWEE